MDPFAEAQLAVPLFCVVCKEAGEDEDVVAVAFCKTCDKPLCAEDEQKHRKRKATSAHPLERLGHPDVAPPCAAHAQPLQIYCITCQTMCCSLCLVDVHPRPDHTAAVLSTHASTLRAAVARAHQQAVARSDELVARLDGLRATMEAVDERSATLKETVAHAFESLVQGLLARRQTLLLEVDTHTAEECATLHAELAADERRWLALHGAATVAERLAAPSSAVDHLGRLAAPVEAHLLASARAVVLPAPPAAVIDFTLSAEVERVLKTAGGFAFRHAYGPLCTAEGAGLSKASVHGGGGFQVTARTRSNDRVTTGGDRVTATIVASSGNGDVRPGTVTDAGTGVYDVAYTVAAAGEYRLHVEVNGRPLSASPFAVTAVARVMCTFTGPPYYDNHGIIYYLATAGGTRPWTNPHDAGVVTVTKSSGGSGTLGQFVANVAPDASQTYFATGNSAPSWIAVSLQSKRVKPTGYVLSIGSYSLAYGHHFPRHWRLEGSNDGATWTSLRAHTNDTTLSQTNVTGYWPVEAQAGSFTHFRILQTGPNSNGDNYLMATSFEVYGELLDP